MLTVSLEEFGLSKYEAQAYVSLISRGTISAGELAYYAEIPRTKAYPTLLKLEKKKLVIISKSKPIMCTAISPEDAFDGAIHDQIEKVNAMNTLVSSLKKVSEESKKTRGSEERRYFQVAANGILDRLRQMIEGSQKSIMISVDQWGLGLLSECREQMASVARRGLEIRVMIPPGQLGSEPFRKMPPGTRVRLSDFISNSFIFDDTEMLFVNSDDGRGAVFSSAEILGASHLRLFGGAWKAAMRTEPMADMTKAEAQEIYRIIRVVREAGLYHTLDSIYRKKDRGLLRLLEDNNVPIHDRTLEEVIDMIDTIMQATCAGNASMDSHGRGITVESKTSSGAIPWAGIINEYICRTGGSTHFVCQNGGTKGERIHIKVEKSTYNRIRAAPTSHHPGS